MSGPQSGLSLVIPAFNEAATIAQAVAEADAALGGLFGAYEIIVVDDGSTDDTAAIVTRLPFDVPHLRLLRHPANRGYGAALRTGFEAARFDLVAFTDADCQFDLRDLGPMADRAATVPVVVGYRVDRKDSLRRRVLSRGYNRLARTLVGTGVRDCDCALKVFRRDVVQRLLPDSRGFFVNTEMLARARRLGVPVAEVPVTHRPRAGGESKVSLREVPKTLRTLLGFWWRETVLRPLAGGAGSSQPIVLAARVPATPPGDEVLRPAAAPRPVTAPARRVGPPAPRPGAA